MLRRLYDWVMRLSASPHAGWALFAIAFAESSFFPIPPDTLLAPMVLAKPQRAWRLAAIYTVGSVIGGVAGYAIGYSLGGVGHWLLAISGHPNGEVPLRAQFAKWGVGVILLQELQNLVNLLGIPSSLNFAVMGTVILIGVLVDQILAQRRGRKISTKAA